MANTRILRPDIFMTNSFCNLTREAQLLYMWLSPLPDLAGYAPFNFKSTEVYLGLKQDDMTAIMPQLQDKVLFSEDHILFLDFHVTQGYHMLDHKKSQVQSIIKSHVYFAKHFKEFRKYHDRLKVLNLTVEGNTFETVGV